MRYFRAMKHLLLFLAIGAGLSSNLRAAEQSPLSAEIKRKCAHVLRQGLRSDEFWPSIHAAEGLTIGGYGAEVRQFLAPKLETETDDQKRCGLARELFRAGDQAQSLIMMDILRSKNDYGWVHAAESLYKVGWIGDSNALQDAYHKPNNIRLKLLAGAALAKYGNGHAEALGFIRRRLATEKDPSQIYLPAWILGRIGGEQDRAAIRSRIPDAPDPSARAFLDNALAALGDKAGQKALTRNFKSSEAPIRTYAAVFAADAGMHSVRPQLIHQLDDENLDARIRAAQALLFLFR
jgi:sialidase-1